MVVIFIETVKSICEYAVIQSVKLSVPKVRFREFIKLVNQIV